MIKDIVSIRGEKILHFHTGECLGYLNWPIIDPDTGVFEAFWVKPLSGPVKDVILLTSDILIFKKNIYIKSEKVFTNPVDVIKIACLLDDGRQFLYSSVQNEKGKRYGWIYNLSFSTETYVLRQIYSKKTFLSLFSRNKFIFPYERVLKVLPKSIIIDDEATKKEKVMNIPPEIA